MLLGWRGIKRVPVSESCVQLGLGNNHAVFLLVCIPRTIASTQPEHLSFVNKYSRYFILNLIKDCQSC